MVGKQVGRRANAADGKIMHGGMHEMLELWVFTLVTDRCMSLHTAGVSGSNPLAPTTCFLPRINRFRRVGHENTVRAAARLTRASSGAIPDEHDLDVVSPASSQHGVGALIQRGGRAVAGMLTIATAGGS